MGNDEILINGTQPEDNTPNGDKTDIADSGNSNITTSLWNNFRAHRKLFILLKTLLFLFITLITSVFFVFFIIYIVPVLQEVKPTSKREKIINKEIKQDAAYKKQITLMTKDIQRLSRKYNAFTSGQSYIVINTTDNRFFLFRNKKLIREGFCSSGSYTMLQTEGNKQWIFKTPKGKYWIHGKTTNPVWKKPDWSFVEEGLPIPPKDDFSRYEYGVLGDYALAIGDGYLIHGTIYKRFLGMPVTHGCVRLNDEDLEVIYNTLSIGSKVYIF
jgi:lipoprotein-anchoring transpeptidase ErfK/SrfK